MKIVVLGASGFIGSNLMPALNASGHQVTGLTRRPDRVSTLKNDEINLRVWDGRNMAILANILDGIDGVVNLAGANIGQGRWTNRRKKKLAASRIQLSGILTEAILQMPVRPSFFIQGSAAGYYGIRPEGQADENAAAGQGYLAELANQWESAVAPRSAAGIRTVFLRNGMVLGRGGGILDRLLMPFSFYAGTTPGSGRQAVSWIHMEDEVRAIRFLIDHPTASGPYNLTSPNPSTMAGLIRAIAKTTGKPAWARIPEWLLKTVLGEMARETILSSQQIIPGKLLKEGFRFRFTDINAAIVDILSGPRS